MSIPANFASPTTTAIRRGLIFFCEDEHTFDLRHRISYASPVNRLLILIAASALVAVASRAVLKHPAPERTSPPDGTKSCCHPAPSRAAMLKAK